MGDHAITGVYETVLYADDVDSTSAFYAGVLGLRLVEGPDELSAAFRLPDGGVVLVFDPSRSGAPGRAVPSHGPRGPGHVAFRIPPGAYDAWRTTLREHGVPIEREVEWARGGRSLYVRDPAGNSVELTADELWPR